MKSKLPKSFAIVGLMIGILRVCVYFYDYAYNPFHLPSVDQAKTLGNYEAPRTYRALEVCLFVMVPGIFLTVFTIDAGNVVNALMWALAVLLNVPIYYAIGMVVAALSRNIRHPNVTAN